MTRDRYSFQFHFSFDYLRMQCNVITKPNVTFHTLELHHIVKMSSLSLIFHVNLLLLLLVAGCNPQLRVDYYRNTCPNVESIVRSAVEKKLQQTFVTAPATLRLFFHDCFVRVSVLIISIFFFFACTLLPIGLIY